MTQTPHGCAHPRVRGSGDGAGGATGGHRRRRRRRRAVAIFAIDRLVRSVAALGFVIVVVVVVDIAMPAMLTDVVVVLTIEEKRATGGWPPRATDRQGLCRRGDGHRGTAGCRRLATIAGAPAPPAFIGGGRSVAPLLFAVTFTAGGERLRGPQALDFLEPGPIHFGTFGAPVLDAGRRFRFRRLAASIEKCGLNLGRLCIMRVCAPTTVEC